MNSDANISVTTIQENSQSQQQKKITPSMTAQTYSSLNWSAGVRPSGVVVSKLDLHSTAHGFEPQSPHYWVQPWASCSHICLCHQAVQLVLANRR